MPWLSLQTHAALIRDPGTIVHTWNSCVTPFRALLGPILATKPGDLLCAAFAAMVAYDLKPYGASTALELRALLDESSLDCDNYCALAAHLNALLRPQSACKLSMVGWDGGAVGNHAQLIAECQGASWLLDPTAGMIAAGCTLDSLCRGERVTYFAFMPENRLPDVRAQYAGALARGLYKASDLLYWFSPALRYVDAHSRPAILATPAGQRRAPTP